MVRKHRFSRFRRFGRKRRIRPTWFPVTGTTFSAEGGTSWYDSAILLGTPAVENSTAEGPVNRFWAVTKDFTALPSVVTGTNTLRDVVEGQTWQLQRLVGKVHLRCNGGSTETQTGVWPYLRVAAGFFVARADEEDQSLPDLFNNEADPWGGDAIQNPWIWRRTWILRNPDSTEGVSVVGDFDTVNSFSAAAEDGPHIDARVKRNVQREQRLFFALSAIGWNGNNQSYPSPEVTQPWVEGVLDLRILGRMTRAKNNSAF